MPDLIQNNLRAPISYCGAVSSRSKQLDSIRADVYIVDINWPRVGRNGTEMILF